MNTQSRARYAKDVALMHAQAASRRERGVSIGPGDLLRPSVGSPVVEVVAVVPLDRVRAEWPQRGGSSIERCALYGVSKRGNVE